MESIWHSDFFNITEKRAEITLCGSKDESKALSWNHCQIRNYDRMNAAAAALSGPTSFT